MLPDAGSPDERAAQSERLRKMLLAMVEDIRVVLIKLAERTQALRFLMSGEERLRRENGARSSRPVRTAGQPARIWQLKWGARRPVAARARADEYKAIARMLDERRVDRELYIAAVVATLKRELAAAGIKADVTGRPKHIYSIWKKMRRKESGIEGLYDIRAVRILVDDLKDCYAALGVVHHLWTPLSGEFDDYIARPKANSYRSLHTAVIGPRRSRSRCRSAPSRCTSTPSTAWPRTGATRRARRRASAATPRSRTASRGCARCWSGRMPSPTPPSG